MVHSHKIRPGKSLLVKTFMVSALAFSALASHAKGGIIKRAEALVSAVYQLCMPKTRSIWRHCALLRAL